MPEDRIPISDFSYTDSLNNSDNLPIIQEESGGSYENFRTDIAAIADHMLNNMEFVSDLHTTAKKIIPAINEAAQGGGGGGGVSASVIADEYDPTATYNTGDYCIYDGGLYVCNDDNVTGAWNSAKWTSIQVMSAVSAIPTDASALPITSGSATNTKDYIDGKFTFSTSERAIGKWIGGETIYEKTISLSFLPNNATASIPHGITGLKRIIEYIGNAYDSVGGTNMPLPFVGGNFIAVSVDNTNIHISTNSDRSNLVGYMTIRYFKQA